jgi:hypothetical protein
MAHAQALARKIGPIALPLMVGIAAAALLLLLLLGAGPELLRGKLPTEGGEPTGQLADLNSAVQQLQGPATVIFGSLASLGMLGGGALLAVGNRKGIQFLASSGLAAAAVLLGNGIAA